MLKDVKWMSLEEAESLKVKDHSDMLSAQYLVNCLEDDHVCHGITTQEPRHKLMRVTLHSRHHSIVFLDPAQAGGKSFRICTHTR